jgi:murein DD-endopeptidase MepM/ murein hydrolase activator NlpD
MHARWAAVVAAGMTVLGLSQTARADALAALEIYAAADGHKQALQAFPMRALSIYRKTPPLQPARMIAHPRGTPDLGSKVQSNARALLFPIPSGARLASPWGYRRDPFSWRTQWHGGVDLAAHTGTPVVATHSGWCSSRLTENSGRIVRVSSKRYITEYRHLSSILRSEGWVRAGEIIGAVGSSGRLCTGPHLHYTLFIGGAQVNPVSSFPPGWRRL